MANRIKPVDFEEINGVPMDGQPPKVKRGRKMPAEMIAETLPVAEPKPKAKRMTKAEKEAEAEVKAAKVKAATIKLYLAKGVGAIGLVLICLSVYHCQDAISLLTNCPWFLALPLAIAIDLGMVACKLCDVLVKDDEELHKWADLYVKGAIGLSVILNVVGFVVHGNKGFVLDPFYAKASQIILGVTIPVLAYVLSRVMGRLVK